MTSSLVLAAMLILIGLGTSAGAQRPYRPTHDEIKNLIARIERNTDVLRSSIDASLDRSRFDGSRAEDNINQFFKDFEQAADRLKGRFSDDNSAVAAAEELLRRGRDIDSFMRRHYLSQRAQRDWLNLYRDLNSLARAYHVGVSWTGATMYPYRVSRDEMKRLIESTEQRADGFRGSLDEALDKSRYDGFRREDDINQFVRDFEVATDNLRERYADDYSAAGAVGEVLRRGALIDRFMQRHTLTARAQSDWRLLRDSLDALARAYNMSMSWKDWTITIL